MATEPQYNNTTTSVHLEEGIVDDGYEEVDGIKSRMSALRKESDSKEVKWQMERKVRKCAVCKIHLSPDCKYMDACKDQPPHTRCFYDRVESQVSASKGVSLGLQELLSYHSSAERGKRLFKYFLSFSDIKENNNAFKCSKCWAASDDIRTKSVFLELSGKGHIVSSDYEMVTSGKF